MAEDRSTVVGAVYRLLRYVLYHLVIVPAAWLLTVVAMRTRIRRRLRVTGPAVLVCNHVHPFDNLAVVRAAWPRMVRFNSQPSNFHIPVAGWILRFFGTLEIGSGRTGRDRFLADNAEILGRGGLVGVFPEGKLVVNDPQLRRLLPGAFVLAEHVGVPVIPVVLRRSGSTVGWVWRRPQLDVVAGPSISGGTSRELRERADAAMRELLARGIAAPPA